MSAPRSRIPSVWLKFHPYSRALRAPKTSPLSWMYPHTAGVFLGWKFTRIGAFVGVGVGVGVGVAVGVGVGVGVGVSTGVAEGVGVALSTTVGDDDGSGPSGEGLAAGSVDPSACGWVPSLGAVTSGEGDSAGSTCWWVTDPACAMFVDANTNAAQRKTAKVFFEPRVGAIRSVLPGTGAGRSALLMSPPPPKLRLGVFQDDMDGYGAFLYALKETKPPDRRNEPVIRAS